MCVRNASIRCESIHLLLEGHLVRVYECERKKARDRVRKGKMVRRQAGRMKALGN